MTIGAGVRETGKDLVFGAAVILETVLQKALLLTISDSTTGV
jgi:hypothetical protein